MYNIIKLQNGKVLVENPDLDFCNVFDPTLNLLPHPQEKDFFIITDDANPFELGKGLKLDYKEVLSPPSGSRAELMQILATDFFKHSTNPRTVEEGIFKFGRRELVSTSESIIHDLPGLSYDFLATAKILKVSSTDVNDNIAGTGARTVEVIGLDALGMPQSEIIEMNGLTEVLTTNTFLRQNRTQVITAGLFGTNEGDILVQSVDDEPQSLVKIGIGKTLMLVYTIPANIVARVMDFDFYTGKLRAILFKVKTRDTIPNAAWQTQAVVDAYQTSVGKKFSNPLEIPPLTDLIATAQNLDQNVVSASGNFELTFRNLYP